MKKRNVIGESARYCGRTARHPSAGQQPAKPRILLKHLLKKLREERQRQGLSLTDPNARSGIDRGTLSKLENDEDPNVTMNTPMRYAEAVGKVILVQLDEDWPLV